MILVVHKSMFVFFCSPQSKMPTDKQLLRASKRSQNKCKAIQKSDRSDCAEPRYRKADDLYFLLTNDRSIDKNINFEISKVMYE